MRKLKYLSLAAAMAASIPAVSYADVAFNVSAVTDYRFRGISQTRRKPAVQGGVDFNAGGFYLGAWASNIKWIKDLDGDASVEVDGYGGYKGEAAGLSYDVGVLRYQYPRHKLEVSPNTTELYGALTYGPATLKYSHAISNTFGNADSKNSYYVDLSAGIDVYEGVMLTPHVGYQRINGPVSDPGSYTDYALTASKDFSGFLVSASVIDTNADETFYSSPVNGKKLGKTTVVVGVKYSF